MLWYLNWNKNRARLTKLPSLARLVVESGGRSYPGFLYKCPAKSRRQRDWLRLTRIWWSCSCKLSPSLTNCQPGTPGSLLIGWWMSPDQQGALSLVRTQYHRQVCICGENDNKQAGKLHWTGLEFTILIYKVPYLTAHKTKLMFYL